MLDKGAGVLEMGMEIQVVAVGTAVAQAAAGQGAEAGVARLLMSLALCHDRIALTG